MSHTHIQLGSNVAQTGSNLNAENLNNVTPPGPVVRDNKTRARTSLVANLMVSATAAVLAVWWCLPKVWSFGETRLLVTVVAGVGATVMVLLNWFQFRRKIWEKIVFISLGGVLVVRPLLPNIAGKVAIAAGWEGDKASAQIAGYLGSSDDATVAGIQLIVGVVVLAFGFFSKSE